MISAASTSRIVRRSFLRYTSADVQRIQAFSVELGDTRLRNDIKNLGSILGSSIKEHDPAVFEAVEMLRKLGREWRTPGGKDDAFEDMVTMVKTWDTKKLLAISRSFSHFLALSNSAENHHRIRRLNESISAASSHYGLAAKADSCVGTIERLLKQEKRSPAEIVDALNAQLVELVLTAHPTEVNRRTMLRKHHKIKEILEKSDDSHLNRYEKKQLQRQLKAEISNMWESDELRRSKPGPVDEANSGLNVVEKVLWYAVPSFIRKLCDVVEGELHQQMPADFAPVKVASWMGGDRDGNPNVTPAITLEVVMLSRYVAANLFKSDLTSLRENLSVTICSPELRQKVGPDVVEPYRHILKELEGRLTATILWTQSQLPAHNPNSRSSAPSSLISSSAPLKRSSELMEPLLLLHRSLVEVGMKEVADGALLDTIRRLACFGLSLMPLDVRQESTKHTEAIDVITRHLGLGSYKDWDEATRRSWLQSELASNRPLIRSVAHLKEHASTSHLTETAVDTLETFELLAKLPPDSVGAYVISQCQQASDILAVMLLQQSAGVKPFHRVVPLFETLDDLQRSAPTIEALFSMPIYRGRINNIQEVMVGYSDSAKDAGRIAASWAQYNAQIEMKKVADHHGVSLTFFHGKGGTVGRGGNPAVYQAILAHPPNTIQGRFRVTEQGEMITQNFGQQAMAERSLDLFTSGVLAERFIQRPQVTKEWKETMERMSEISCAAYRKIVREEARFVSYFRKATPELELAGLNVGSRPAKRNPKGGVESLRAIPWVFAWTQTRLNLPAWLGVGQAFNQELQQNPMVIKQMYKDWPWFRTVVNLLQMILAKSELKIAEMYDEQLVKDDEESLTLGKELRQQFSQTVESILNVADCPHLISNDPILQRSLSVRNPYVDPLNIIQAELLRRMRQDGEISAEERKFLQDALLITINGVANGMRNSG